MIVIVGTSGNVLNMDYLLFFDIHSKKEFKNSIVIQLDTLKKAYKLSGVIKPNLIVYKDRVLYKNITFEYQNML